MIVVADLLIRSSLILESVEEGIPMHVDIGLLPEESLSVSTELVKEASVVIVLHHHLLLLELVLIILELLYPFEGRLPDGHILCRPYVEIDLHLVDFCLGLDAHLSLRAELSLLGEEVLEEDCDRRFHLLKDVFVDDLFSDLVASVTSRATACDSSEVGHLVEDFFDVLEDYLGLFAEESLERTEAVLL